VKPEQASKVKSWTPTRHYSGEGRVEQGSNRQTHLFRSIGVVGTACWKGESGNWGRPTLDEDSGLNGMSGAGLRGSRTGS